MRTSKAGSCSIETETTSKRKKAAQKVSHTKVPISDTAVTSGENSTAGCPHPSGKLELSNEEVGRYPTSMNDLEDLQLALFPDPDLVAAKQSENNAVALFALAQIKGCGFVTVKSLCDEFSGKLTDVFKADREHLTSILYDIRTPNPSAVAAEIKDNSKAIIAEGRRTWQKYKAKGVSLVFRDDEDYPKPLLDLVSPPSWLFIEGDRKLLNSEFLVGFVGTRTPTEHGAAVARRASAHIARMNSVILSGLAEGIDAVGHQTALLYGSPTVAVLGHGIDVIFPASTAKIRQDIVLFGGAVISEYLPTDNYSRDKFVQRNRIQAALSKAVCFVEAREKSGTAHTLRFAQHLNRPVFGVTCNGFMGVPEEELLHVLQAGGGTVFDIANEKDVHDLYELVHKAFTEDAKIPTADAPQMFRNVLLEVKRQSIEYGATRGNITWLAKELLKLAKTVDGGDRTEEPRRVTKKRKSANQSSDSNEGRGPL